MADKIDFFKSTKDFFIAVEDNGFLIYTSDNFKLTELDMLELIKTCYVERRRTLIGKKLLAIYRDCMPSEISKKKLNLIGVKDEIKIEPTRAKKPTLI